MIKIVNVKPVLPILALRTPIMGEVLNCRMSDGDILQCIYSRAFVDEVLEDGTLVRLNLSNYNKDNSHLMKNNVKIDNNIIEAPVVETIIEPVKEEVKVEETVVETKVEETPVKETVIEPVKEEVKVEETVVETKVEETPVVEEQHKERKNNKKNKK